MPSLASAITWSSRAIDSMAMAGSAVVVAAPGAQGGGGRGSEEGQGPWECCVGAQRAAGARDGGEGSRLSEAEEREEAVVRSGERQRQEAEAEAGTVEEVASVNDCSDGESEGEDGGVRVGDGGGGLARAAMAMARVGVHGTLARLLGPETEKAAEDEEERETERQGQLDASTLADGWSIIDGAECEDVAHRP